MIDEGGVEGFSNFRCLIEIKTALTGERGMLPFYFRKMAVELSESLLLIQGNAEGKYRMLI